MTCNLNNKVLPAGKAGFTLIETLIAIGVLMIAIVGPLTLAQKGLQATLISKDQNSAFYLAQDALEYVRWVRDTNKLRGSSNWLDGLNGTANGFSPADGLIGDCLSTTGTQHCTINSLQPLGQNAIQSCGANGAACPAINYDSTNNFFSYTSGTPSIFTRTVSIANCAYGGGTCTSSQNPDEAVVSATVSWRDQGSLMRSITVRESLFNWQ